MQISVPLLLSMSEQRRREWILKGKRKEEEEEEKEKVRGKKMDGCKNRM